MVNHSCARVAAMPRGPFAVGTRAGQALGKHQARHHSFKFIGNFIFILLQRLNNKEHTATTKDVNKTFN